MRIIKYPNRSEWKSLLTRPQKDQKDLSALVQAVLDRIKAEGDAAVKDYERQFDHVELDTLQVSEAEMEEAEALVSDELKDALRLAHANIETFHAAQRFESKKVETQPGVVCWQ